MRHASVLTAIAADSVGHPEQGMGVGEDCAIGFIRKAVADIRDTIACRNGFDTEAELLGPKPPKLVFYLCYNSENYHAIFRTMSPFGSTRGRRELPVEAESTQRVLR